MERRIFEEEHEMFRDSVRSFMQNEIAPHSDRWHEAGIVDREAFLKAGEMGFLLMWADEKYGGIGVRDFVHRIEESIISVLEIYGLKGERVDGAPTVPARACERSSAATPPPRSGCRGTSSSRSSGQFSRSAARHSSSSDSSPGWVLAATTTVR